MRNLTEVRKGFVVKSCALGLGKYTAKFVWNFIQISIINKEKYLCKKVYGH